MRNATTRDTLTMGFGEPAVMSKFESSSYVDIILEFIVRRYNSSKSSLYIVHASNWNVQDVIIFVKEGENVRGHIWGRDNIGGDYYFIVN